RYGVVSSELTAGDSFILFYFEYTLTSQRFHVKDESDSLKESINDNNHSLRISKDLVWHSDITAHLSIIESTRACKS
ncbi:cell division protein FtsK, partial [Streptococcus suis]